MELLEAIRQRRSIRKFTAKEIPEKILLKIITSGTWAPYGAERWMVIIVKDDKAKNEMMAWFVDQKRNLHVLSAPANLVVCCDLRDKNWPAIDKRNHGKRDHRELFSIQESAAMIQNMLLTAHEEGLGSCWNGSFDEKVVSQVLSIPHGVRPIAIISLGYTLNSPKPPKRKKTEEIIYYENFL